MNNKDKEHVKKVYIEKAEGKLMICIILSIISLITYLFPLLSGKFDFRILFDILSLILIVIAKKSIPKDDETYSKRFIIFAMISIGCLLIYDILTIIPQAYDALDLTFLGMESAIQEIFTVLSLIVLFAVNNDLRKAYNPEKYERKLDWFYEKPEEENKDNIDNH